MVTDLKALKYKPKYFTDSEFKRASPACSLSDMSPQFMKFLDEARKNAGIPFVISSAYRSVEHELKRGRAGTSSHCKGIAVDIACSSSLNRLKIVQALLDCGAVRIGIHPKFIHVDLDYTKPQCIWLYETV